LINRNADYEFVAKATRNLNARFTNYTALSARISELKSTSNNNYTTDTWNAFQDALSAAQSVANNANATQTQVDNALNDLNSTYRNLQLKKMIFSTKYEATFLNWILFFLCFGWIWMWF